eukprot:GILI01002110.1.p1 GENE.GILI01002110.1~~GILI01002110.1.p1  ORF type:complete len:106 (+),score=49.09 GILI01002110.1:47-319(+)
MRSTLSEQSVAEGIDAEGRQSIQKISDESMGWLDENQNAEAEEYKAKVKAIEAVAHPILSAFYAKRAMESKSAPAEGAEGEGPQTDDVDE